MGLFDFVKSAGEKLFGSAEPKTNPAALVEAVNKWGLKVEGLDIGIEDDVAIVSGTVESQAEREKVVLVVGNTEGIAKVDDRLKVKAPEPEAKFYTVVKGDTLSKIAKEYCGDAMKYPVIFDANKPMLKDPDLIYPGQVLRIPPQ